MTFLSGNINFLIEPVIRHFSKDSTQRPIQFVLNNGRNNHLSCFQGGYQAVVWCDVFQAAIILIGVIVIDVLVSSLCYYYILHGHNRQWYCEAL